MMALRTSGRAIQMDLLRAAACIMVIVMHVVADGVYAVDVHSVKWTVLTVYSSLCRGAVPVFFMLSGMFSRSTDWRRAIRKACGYLLIYAAWTVLYRAADVFGPHWLAATEASVTWASFFDGLLYHKYHLWFLPAFAGVTLFAPAVNAIAERQKNLIDYLAAIFVVCTLSVRTLRLTLDGRPDALAWLSRLPDFSMSYIGFYVLGRCICEHREALLRKQWLVYALGFLGMTGVFMGTRSASLSAGQMSDLFYDHFNLLIALQALAWIVLFWQLRIPQCLHGIVSWLAGHSLFIYLVHVLVIDVMMWCGIYAHKVHWLLGVPIKSAAVFAVCCVLCVLKDAMKKAWRMGRDGR